MPRRVGRSAPEAKVEHEIMRPLLLQELGFDEQDLHPGVGVEFFPTRGGEIDWLVKIGGQPLIVIEVEGSRRQFEKGFKQARAYAIFLRGPERPIPYVMVIAGRKARLFRAEAPPTGPGVVYVPTQKLLTKNEILEAVGIPDEALAGEVTLLETFMGLFERIFQLVQTSKRPKFSDEKAVHLLAGLLQAKVRGQSTDAVYEEHRLPKRIRRLVDERLEFYSWPKHRGSALGYAFRNFVKRTFTGGPLKRYFTPPEVIAFMVDLIRLKPGRLVLDPVCGSGGFLGRIALEWQRRGLEPGKITQSLIGLDIDPLAVETSRTFLELLGIGEADQLRIYHKNSLTSERRYPWEEDLTGLLVEETFDVLIGNPPAGTPVQQAEELQRSGQALPPELTDLLDFFDDPPDNYQWFEKRRWYEVAFLERALQLVRPGGEIVLILPDGIFANRQMRFIRDHLVTKTTIELIVGLPRGIFPFTPSKMCIIYLSKRQPPMKHQAFMAEVPEQAPLATHLERIGQAYRAFKKGAA